MAKLQMLSFEDDEIIDRRIREESNYCDVAHLYVASKWDEELPRCADSRKSAINKTGWDGDTFRVSIGRPKPFDEIKVELPAKTNDCPGYCYSADK